MPKNYFRKGKIGKMANFGAKRFKLNLINLKGGLIEKIWESCRWGRQPEVVTENRSEPNYEAATLHVFGCVTWSAEVILSSEN